MTDLNISLHDRAAIRRRCGLTRNSVHIDTYTYIYTHRRNNTERWKKKKGDDTWKEEKNYFHLYSF